jgi:uncharacterized membrane protein YtjA (UPF0391 family)
LVPFAFFGRRKRINRPQRETLVFRSGWGDSGTLWHAGKGAFMGLLRWALAFFFIALIAGAFGWFGIAAGAESIARFLFFLFLAIVVLFVILAAFAGRTIGGP